MRILTCLSTALTMGIAAHAAADEITANPIMPKFYYSTTPEGKTLPTGVARIRIPYQLVNGSTTYDKDGNKSDSLFSYNATGAAFVFEYGITDRLSFQWKTDFYLKQTTSVNSSSAAYGTLKSGLYTSRTSALAAATNTSITDQNSLQNAIKTAFIGGCVKAGGAAATCATDYESGALKSTAATALGLGTSFGAGSASVSAKDYASAASSATETAISSGLASATASAEATGGRGLGDTIFGLLYEAYNTDSFFLSVGGGVRLPTGKRNLGANEIDTTRSAYELGLRLNLDYLPIDWFMLSWQNQSEGGIVGTKRDVSGVSQTTTRNGIRNVGFVYLKPSLAPISMELDGIKTQVGMTYDFDSAEKVSINDVESTTDRSQQMWAYAGIGYSLLGFGVPAQLDLEYETPMGKNKNVTIATTKTTATLKTFARF